MASDVTLMVLPTVAAGPGVGRPQIFLERGGMWCDLSIRDAADVSRVRRIVGGTLTIFMRRIIQNPEADVWSALKTLCLTELYEALIPARLHEVFQQAAVTAAGDDVPVLRIHTPIDWIPWELMHDGTGFLGLRFQIARLPIGPTVPDLGANPQRSVQRIYNLLGQHLFDEQQLVDQWETTFSGLTTNGAQEVRFPSAGGAGNDYPKLKDLEEAQEPDILHVTCHGGQVDEDGQVYWTLDHRAQFPWDYRIQTGSVTMLGKTAEVFERRPLVFGNACASVQAAAGAQAASNGGLASGFGPTFFAQGAIAFIGTLVAISESMSVRFPRTFYQKLLGEGLNVGKALWATKKHFADLAENDPSWLFYCLYGRPETQFAVGQSSG